MLWTLANSIFRQTLLAKKRDCLFWSKTFFFRRTFETILIYMDAQSFKKGKIVQWIMWRTCFCTITVDYFLKFFLTTPQAFEHGCSIKKNIKKTLIFFLILTPRGAEKEECTSSTFFLFLQRRRIFMKSHWISDFF